MLPFSYLAITAVGSVLLLGLGHYAQVEYEVSSDGDRYLTMGRGVAVPFPFMFRWLVPRLCGTSITRWMLCTDLHLVLLPVLTAVYVGQWGVRHAASTVGGLLVCGFPGIFRQSIRRPVLVDAPALTWALLAAVLLNEGWWMAAVVVAVVAAAIKETAPVFAACFALHALPLVALVVPLLRWVLVRGGDDTHHSLAISSPLRWARQAHARRLFDPLLMVAPWGAGVLAVLVSDRRIALALALALAAGYSQLAFAGNTVRLYQWAGPAVALGAASVLPTGWEPAALLAHLFNPWAGDGR